MKQTSFIFFVVVTLGSLLATFGKTPSPTEEFVKALNQSAIVTSVRHHSVGGSVFRGGGGFSFGK